uniref:Uncharacterized protein n=1 Tax=Proboscia inermis TaxID=420281 RepID=A0A7S0C7Y5_9STRA
MGVGAKETEQVSIRYFTWTCIVSRHLLTPTHIVVGWGLPQVSAFGGCAVFRVFHVSVWVSINEQDMGSFYERALYRVCGMFETIYHQTRRFNPAIFVVASQGFCFIPFKKNGIIAFIFVNEDTPERHFSKNERKNDSSVNHLFLSSFFMPVRVWSFFFLLSLKITMTRWWYFLWRPG